MTIAQGSSTKVVVEKEINWGVKAAAAGARYLRRVTSGLQLSKDTYESKEIREDQQTAVFRHGVRKVEGDFNGELSPGTYSDLLAAALRKAFAAGPSVTGNIALVANVFTGADFEAAKFKVGHVVRATGLASAGNNDRNLIVLEVTDTSLTVDTLGGAALVNGVALAGVTIAMQGKSTFTPESGHTDDSFTFEHFYSDIGESEVFTGVKVGDVDIKLPPTGMAEISLKLQGKDMESAQVAHFTNPTPTSTTNTLAAVNGRVYAMGSRLTLLTGLNISIKGNLSTEPVVGSNTAPAIFRGRVQVSGDMSAFFENGQLRDAFIDEGEITLFAVFTLSDAQDAEFMAFRMPRIKLGGATKADGEKGIVQSVPYTALKGDTTLEVQDSTL